jgi:DNA (cytosine-5)-methyltransferase 1
MENLHELALFAGAGGGILGGHLLGWRTVCAVEWEQYPASVLCARQNDGILPPFPIWDDVQTFDGKPWRGIVDVVSGGFPCQDISSAGKGAGIDGERSSMWKHMARIIGEVRPQYVFVENSPMLTTRGLGVVLADLSKMGFDAKWGVVSAADVGANHQRERIWIRAEQRNFFSHTKHNGDGRRQQQSESLEEKDVVNTQSCGGGRITGEFQAQNEQQTTKRQERRFWQSDNASEMAYTSSTRLQRLWDTRSNGESISKQRFSWGGFDSGSNSWWEVEPNISRVANGVAARVDRLKAIGNGQVPLCAATAWELLK